MFLKNNNSFRITTNVLSFMVPQGGMTELSRVKFLCVLIGRNYSKSIKMKLSFVCTLLRKEYFFISSLFILSIVTFQYTYHSKVSPNPQLCFLHTSPCLFLNYISINSQLYVQSFNYLILQLLHTPFAHFVLYVFEAVLLATVKHLCSSNSALKRLQTFFLRFSQQKETTVCD